jgi:hypothetical protein
MLQSLLAHGSALSAPTHPEDRLVNDDRPIYHQWILLAYSTARKDISLHLKLTH